LYQISACAPGATLLRYCYCITKQQQQQYQKGGRQWHQIFKGAALRNSWKTFVQSKRKCVKSHKECKLSWTQIFFRINREHIILDFITSRDKETSHKLRLDIMVIATTNYADIDLIEYVQKDVTRDIGGTWRYT
jgi:hypothetical protein